MIAIKNLQKSYGDLKALKGINLKVARGELFAYLGPNGAGKSTTIRILTGLTRMDGGQALIGGYDIEREMMAAKRQFGVVHQYINLDQELTVYENLDLHGQLFGMNRPERKRRIGEILEAVALAERAATLVKKLSGGLKRRVTIGRALLHQPGILFLDEPTTGLDAAIRRRIWALIKEIQQQGTTIFLTTHQIDEAEILAERVAFIDEGKIVALDTPQALMGRVGEWAIDQLDADGISTSYFPTREEAVAARTAGAFTLRRVNLEDAFLAFTGKSGLAGTGSRAPYGKGH